ncbi:amino acid ABC transporter substrate-binding protein [Prevotella multiformis]|uniref:LysM domain protein n=1 Tax=Prevotella multiformis DSM 16608 TaxID=888743 RepID=F0F6F4_9BACT|nr:ABC transporter substrate-binding protein [Prevotella multiformis]EGC20236.1 LysM domain protein [Prevotella multiformis DSM 16608]
MRSYLKYLLLLFAVTFSYSVLAQTVQWRDQHKVKRKETIFGIAKEYGITIPQLLEANPSMKQPGYELKKGELIFVPFSKEGDFKPDGTIMGKTGRTAKPANPVAPVPVNAVRVGIMLPLHNQDGDGRRMVEYYRGVLLALDQLKSEGITTDVHAWNVPKGTDIHTTLLEPNAAKLDIIFGPLYSEQVKPLADFCRNNGIKLVIPFSTTSNEVGSNPNVFQVYQTDATLNNKAIAAFLERFQKSHHPVFINCKDASSQVGDFTSSLRRQLELQKIKYDLTSTSSSATDFSKHFDATRPNVVIVNSEKSPQLNEVFAKLDQMKKTRPGIAVSLFGYNQWFVYQDYDLDQFFRYNTYIPSTYYYNKAADKTKSLEAKYSERYGEPMSKQYIPRMALTGYDQAEFFVRGLKAYGKNFKGTAAEVKYRPLQTRYDFVRVGQGGYVNDHFQLVHFKTDQTMENLVY